MQYSDIHSTFMNKRSCGSSSIESTDPNLLCIIQLVFALYPYTRNSINIVLCNLKIFADQDKNNSYGKHNLSGTLHPKAREVIVEFSIPFD